MARLSARRSSRRFIGGGVGDLRYFPDKSIVITPLDPKDPQSPPVVVSKEFAEKEISYD